MHILLVSCVVKPDRIDEFIAATRENARSSRLEPGVVRFDLIQQTDDPTRFRLIEIYRSPEGHAAHRQSAHYLAWADAASDLLAEPRTRDIFHNVDPAGPEW